jgi:hypothetical protein
MGRFGLHDVHAPPDYDKMDLTHLRAKGKAIQHIRLR